MDIRFFKIKEKSYLIELIKKEKEFILLVNSNGDINLRNTVIKIEEKSKKDINIVLLINSETILKESYTQVIINLAREKDKRNWVEKEYLFEVKAKLIEKAR